MDNSTDKVVSVFLKFGADQQSIQKAVAEFKKIEAEISALEKEAKSLKSVISASMEHGGDTADLAADLKTVEAAISNLRKKADSELGAGLTSSFDRVAQSAKQTGASVGQSFNLRDIGEKINYVGLAMQNAGQGITNSLMGTINAYLSAADQYDSEAMRWNAAQSEMQNAYQRIGAVALDELTPIIEQAADLLSMLADFVEKNPDLIKVIAGTGAALTLGGQLVSGLASVAMIAGSFQGLTKLLGASGALSGVAAGASAAGGAALAAGVYGGAAVAGGAIGMGLGNAVNRATGQQEQSVGDIARTIQEISAATSGLGLLSQALKAAGFDDQAAAVWSFVKSINGLGDATQDAERKTQSTTSTFAQKNVQMFIDYEKQKADAAQQYGENVAQAEADAENRRVEIIKNFADQAAQAERQYTEQSAKAQRDYQSQVGKMASNYARQERQAEEDYYKARADAAKTFGVEVERMEQDHQREMLKLQDEHNGRVNDLVAARDALGLVKEQQAYEKSRSEAEIAYQTEAQRKNHDYARQMADMESAFATARARRRADYATQINDAREQFILQQAERAQQHARQMEQIRKNEAEQLAALEKSRNDQLAKLRQGYDKQTQMMQTAFVDRINAMSTSIQGNTTAWVNYMKSQANAFEAFLQSKGYVGVSAPGRAIGGAVNKGKTYTVGENGPEIFTAPADGTIIPAGMTYSLLNGGGNRALSSGQRTATLRIETQSLTLEQVLSEVDRRFATYDQALNAAWEG